MHAGYNRDLFGIPQGDNMADIGPTVFFMYDKCIVEKESDDPSNAIIYFHPATVSVNDQVALCGQLMGMSHFLTSITGTLPTVFKMATTKYAFKHIGKYSLVIGCDVDAPDSVATRLITRLCDTFRLYHHSIERVTKSVEFISAVNFKTHMGRIWDTLVPFLRCYGDEIAAGFGSLPDLQLPKGETRLYLKASHLLQTCRGGKGVLDGCLIFRKKVLCTQLSPSLTAKLMLIRPQQHNVSLPQ
ncbi:PREDICTED: Hermansky-Pudlak syndrome 4 protein-like [Priapulus caudatus]|uniref:Hermansky-Pudlak syndrome 4 protein-like n=1 Tax=Priapulus caudatus TaxID=37621 RepID=A0ABM1EZC7_PRICU|nr:PREDICTED: Hermansky-Pudlak syndrome 4 protein-like [Priapulus caudatus]